MAERAQRDHRLKKVADMDRFARHIEEFPLPRAGRNVPRRRNEVTGQPHGFFLAVSEVIVVIRYACSS